MKLLDQYKLFKRNLKKKVQEAGWILEGEYHRIIAIDTGKLDLAIQTDSAVDRGAVISVDVGSEGVFYAVFVDQGIGQVFNYHQPPPPGKDRKVIWTGNGLHYMERGLRSQADAIKSKILETRISEQ